MTAHVYHTPQNIKLELAFVKIIEREWLRWVCVHKIDAVSGLRYPTKYGHTIGIPELFRCVSR